MIWGKGRRRVTSFSVYCKSNGIEEGATVEFWIYFKVKINRNLLMEEMGV